MDKKGLSMVVTTLILILLVLVAVGIVWVVVNNILSEQTEEISSGFGSFFLNLELSKVQVDANGDLTITVKRGVGAGDLSAVHFIISDGENSKGVQKDTTLTELGSQTFTISSLEISGLTGVKEVSIAPVLKSDSGKGNLGNIVDTYTVSEGQLFGGQDNPGSSCLDLLNSGKTTDGIYWIDPEGSGSSFQVYCDMTTDDGGWTLVWSNLRTGTGKPVTGITWNNAINTQSKYSGSFGNDLEQFNFYLGLKYWSMIASNNELRYYWKHDYGSSIDEEFISTFNLDASHDYTISITNYQQEIGSQQAGIYSYHNNRPFSTVDSDHDSNSGSCASYYSNTPWWYGGCWSGSINGGGENSGSGYYNGAYWYSSARQWGTSTGIGAGNGWIWVR